MLYSPSNPSSPLLSYTPHAIVLDIRKAFNTLSWAHLKETFHCRGLDDSFLHWVDTLHSQLTASVKYIGYESSKFPNSQGMCQGCPLFPLLFMNLFIQENGIVWSASKIGIASFSGLQVNHTISHALNVSLSDPVQRSLATNFSIQKNFPLSLAV